MEELAIVYLTSDTLTKFFIIPAVQEILIQLLSTLVGVLVGFILAMAWDEHQDKIKTRKIRDQVLQSIFEELQETMNGVKIFYDRFDLKWDSSKKTITGTFGLAAISAFESVVNSGNFTLLSASLQDKISTTYQRIRLFNADIEQIRGFYMMPVIDWQFAEERANNLIGRAQTTAHQLMQDIKDLLPSITAAKKYATYY